MDLKGIKLISQFDHDFNDTKRDSLYLESDDNKIQIQGLLTILPYWGEETFSDHTGWDRELEGFAVYVSINQLIVEGKEQEFIRDWKKEAESDLEDRIKAHLEDDELTKGTIL